MKKQRRGHNHSLICIDAVVSTLSGCGLQPLVQTRAWQHSSMVHQVPPLRPKLRGTSAAQKGKQAHQLPQSRWRSPRWRPPQRQSLPHLQRPPRSQNEHRAREMIHGRVVCQEGNVFAVARIGGSARRQAVPQRALAVNRRCGTLRRKRRKAEEEPHRARRHRPRMWCHRQALHRPLLRQVASAAQDVPCVVGLSISPSPRGQEHPSLSCIGGTANNFPPNVLCTVCRRRVRKHELQNNTPVRAGRNRSSTSLVPRCLWPAPGPRHLR
mmetsp:Transcript_29758/g.79074  ORF Transcript_29758/g.79074 Transcript_29758/m.79074 type:complete len:268 (+) Transcript_29758:283-1086(+)